MLWCIPASSSWGSQVIKEKQASEITFTSSRTTESLLWYTFQCVEWKATSVPEQCSCSCGFSCDSFIKHRGWALCFLIFMLKNLPGFHEPQFSRTSQNTLLSDSVCRLRNYKQKGWIWLVELFKFGNMILNFDHLIFPTALVIFINQIFCTILTMFWLDYCGTVYDSIEHADYTIEWIEKPWLCSIILWSTYEAARALKK